MGKFSQFLVEKGPGRCSDLENTGLRNWYKNAEHEERFLAGEWRNWQRI